MRILIIGLGSIAEKHITVLEELVPELKLTALRSGKSNNQDSRVNNIYSIDELRDEFEFIMVTNPTAEHFSTIRKFAGLKIPLFIEKPPLMNLKDAKDLVNKINSLNTRTYVAFNMRFHPVINWLKKTLTGKRVYEVQVYCGSYLPDWRPNQNYQKSYSAHSDRGGGVHLDLIHELDYILWLFGYPHKIQGSKSKISDLEINSMDSAHYWLDYDDMGVSIILNYFRPQSKRSIEIVTDSEIYYSDLIAGTIQNSSGEVIFQTDETISSTYFNQMKYFLEGLRTGKTFMNDLKESLKTLELCLV